MHRESDLKGYWDQIRDRVSEGWNALAEEGSSAYRREGEPMIRALRKKTGLSRDAIERVLDAVADRGSSAAESVHEGAHHVARRARGGVRRGLSAVHEGYEGAEDVVRENPMPSVLVAFGIGLLAGAIAMAVRDLRDS